MLGVGVKLCVTDCVRERALSLTQCVFDCASDGVDVFGVSLWMYVWLCF